MDIFIENKTDSIFGAKEENIINKIIEKTVFCKNYHENIEISILIVNNEEIKILNKEFRNINLPTDVLSFPLIEPENIEKAFETNQTVFLGDIVISIDKIFSQSQEYNHSFERELAFLVAHSMLHLLGYDHMTKNDETEMFALQEKILIEAGFGR